MIKFATVILGLLIISSTVISLAADDPSIQGKDRTESQNAMKEYVNKNSMGGKFIVYDGMMGKLLKLKYEDVHEGIVKKGDFYVSCADFVDHAGNKYDIDFLVAEKEGKFTVFQALVHKVNGEKRDYLVE